MIKRFLIATVIFVFCILGFHFLSTYLTILKAKSIQEAIDAQADDIINKMSPSDLIGQLIHVSIPEKTLEKTALKEIENIHPGGVIVFGKNLGTKEEILSLTNGMQLEMKKIGGLPLLISTDQEGGRVIRVQKSVTEFPGAMAVGQTKNEEMAYNVGFVTSYDLNQLGINFLLAPDVDINNNPENPVINTRSFGSSLEMVSRQAVSYERGARNGGSIPVIKHFPGHGDTNVDSHLGLPFIDKSLEELSKFELIPFQKAIENGAKVVMSAHIVYPKIDPKYPATLSSKILTDILRKQLKFNGVIITDAMEMHAISKNFEKENPAAKAILAGADIILLTSWGATSENFKKILLKSYEAGEFTVNNEDLIKTAVKRQLRLKIEQGLLSQSFSAFPVTNPELVAHLSETAEKQKKEYAEITNIKFPKLNQDVSRAAIKSYPTEFKKLSAGEKTILSINNPVIKSEFEKRKFKIIPRNSIINGIKSLEEATVVVDTFSQNDLNSAKELASKKSIAKVVILHYGTPFLDLPKSNKITILFSFSPTLESLKALSYSVFQTENDSATIQPIDLILKTKTE